MIKIIMSSLVVSTTLFFGACSSKEAEVSTQKATSEMQKPDATLQETYWQLTSFGMLRMGVSGKSHIILKNDGRVVGSGSCNRLMSTYKTSGDTLHFTQAASTMMACPNMKEEQMFFQALAKVDSYKISGERLELFENNKLILVFKAVYLQ